MKRRKAKRMISRSFVRLARILLPAAACMGIAEARSQVAQSGETSTMPIVYQRSDALVVVEANYREAWGSLPDAVTEGHKVADALKRQGFVVKLLINQTGDELRETMEAMLANQGGRTDSRMVLFFSGHGLSRLDNTKGYFVPVDAPLVEVDQEGFLAKAVSMEEFRTWARAMTAKHVLFIFDSCFSGSVFLSRGGGGEAGLDRNAIDRPVRQFITSGSATEKVPAQSALVPVLLRGLAGDADLTRDGIVEGTELGLFIQREVPLLNDAQTPQTGKLPDLEFSRGEIVFGPFPVRDKDQLESEVGQVLDPVEATDKVRFRTPLYAEIPFTPAFSVFGESISGESCWDEDYCTQSFFVRDADGRYAIREMKVLSDNTLLGKHLRALVSKYLPADSVVEVKGQVRGTDWTYVRTVDGSSGYVDGLSLERGVLPVTNVGRVAFVQRIFSEFPFMDVAMDFGHYKGRIDGVLGDDIREAVVSFKRFKNSEALERGERIRRIDYGLDDDFIADAIGSLGCWDGC
jgi:Caspase domain